MRFVRAEVVSVNVHPHSIAVMGVQEAAGILERVGFIKSISVRTPIVDVFEHRHPIHDDWISNAD